MTLHVNSCFFDCLKDGNINSCRPVADLQKIFDTSSDAEIRKLENRVYDAAFEYEMMYDVMISVNIKNEEHFNYWPGALPYYDNVKKEGIVLAG